MTARRVKDRRTTSVTDLAESRSYSHFLSLTIKIIFALYSLINSVLC